MSLQRIFILLIVLGSCLPTIAGKKKDKPIVFADVTERGRALYEYDQAAWHGTDAVLAMHPPKDFHPRYISRKTESGWTTVFGTLNDKRDRFEIFYEAKQGRTLQNFTAERLEMPREDTAFYLSAAKAIDAALADFHGERRPYNVAVLPAANNQLYVYIYPAQVKNDVYPLGGDIRYLFAADGGAIVERRQLHKTILEVQPGSIPKGAKPAGGYHTHVLSDIPEDTDVFYVLTRKPSQPEFVATMNRKLYGISEDGTIWEGKL